MGSLFHFKRFSVDQAGCAMKINTDGVLLAALLQNEDPTEVLDIGTGTGVIALMLAQRYKSAKIEAVEIDEEAARTAANNFLNSPFTARLTCRHSSFKQNFSRFPDRRFDLIVSNPPFFLNSLKNPEPGKSVARHTDPVFFSELFSSGGRHLSDEGVLWLILPQKTLDEISALAKQQGLFIKEHIRIRSFKEDEPHRGILSFSKRSQAPAAADFVIYEDYKIYSEQYKEALAPFFTIF